MAPENGHDGGEGNQKTVFIDTSLETHLATIVSDSDTVSDLKRKIVLEHRRCFPAIGDIKIHCLKVKRRGNHYHLPDSMLVKSAFGTTQKNWFLTVDASHFQQSDGIQHNNHGDQLALPWVKDNHSIDTHDSQANRPSKLSLIHGSPSNHPKFVVPFVNQKIPNVDHFTSNDSCKEVSEEDRLSNFELELDSRKEEKLFSVDKEIKSKKRTRDVNNEDVSVIKRRKTKRIESDVKGSEDRVLTDDVDKVKEMGTSVNDENSIEDKSKSKDAGLDGVVTKAMNDEDARTILVNQKKPKKTRKGKNSVKVANIVPLSVEDVEKETRHQKNTEASEVILDVEMTFEKNIHQEMPLQLSQKEKDNEIVQEADIGNEIPSLKKGVTADDELLVKDADDFADMSSTVPTPIIDEQKKDNAEIINDEKNEVLEKTFIDNSLVDNNKADYLIVNEVKITEPTESDRSQVHKEKSKKRIKKTSGNRNKKKDIEKSSKNDEIMKQSNNDVVIVTNEDNFLPPESVEKTSIDALHVYNDAEITKTSQQNAEISEKQNENMDDTKKKKKEKKRKIKKLDTRNEGGESLTNHANVDLHKEIADVSQADVTDGDKLKEKDAKISDELVKKAKKNHKSLKGHSDMPSKLESEQEKSKTPEVTSKDVTESQVSKGENVNSDVDISKEGANDIDFMEYFSPSQQQANKISVLEKVENRKDNKLFVKEKKSKKKSKEQDDSVIQSLSRNETDKELLATKKISEASTDEVVAKDQNAPDVTKVKTQKTTTKIDAFAVQSLSRNETNKELLASKKIPEASTDEAVVKDQNAPNATKAKTKKTTKKVDASTIQSLSRNETNKELLATKKTPEGSTDGAVVKDQNAPNVNKVKTQKTTTKVDVSRNETNKEFVASKKIPEASTNGAATKDQNAPDISKVKTQKTTKKIDAKPVQVNKPQPSGSSSESSERSLKSQKITKQQPTMTQTPVKTMKKNVPGVKSLLNTPGTIFGADSDESSTDDNSVINSDSTTRTPSRNSSSSGESDSSIDSKRFAMKRREGAGKNNASSQNRLQNVSMADLLRSSSRFKKARVSASKVNDTESEPVDFVPESQPVA